MGMDPAENIYGNYAMQEQIRQNLNLTDPIALAVAAERERCAKIAESMYVKDASDEEFIVRREIAAKIREGK